MGSWRALPALTDIMGHYRCKKERSPWDRESRHWEQEPDVCGPHTHTVDRQWAGPLLPLFCFDAVR